MPLLCWMLVTPHAHGQDARYGRQTTRSRDDPSFREFPEDQVLPPSELKAMLARVQMERARAEVARMIPEELLQAVREEVLADLPEETRLKIIDIAQDVAATNGNPRNRQEHVEMIEEVRQRLQSEMPEAWDELASANEKNRETFERLQKMVPQLAENGRNGNGAGRNSTGSFTLDPSDSASIDNLLNELISQSGQPGSGQPGSGQPGSGRAGTSGNGRGSRDSRNSRRRLIEQLMQHERRRTINQGDRPADSPTQPREPRSNSNAQNDVPSPQAAEPPPSMKDRTDLTMAQRFNRMLKDVSDRTNEATPKKAKRSDSDLGGLEPYFDRFSKSIQSSVHESFVKSAQRSSGRRRSGGSSNSRDRSSFLGLGSRDNGAPPPTPPKYSLGEVAVPFFLLLSALVAWIFIRNRSVLLEGADRYLNKFSSSHRETRDGELPSGLVAAVDTLVMREFDAEASIWNHSQVQTALNSVKPDLKNDIVHLMKMYKSVRYSPDLATTTTQETRARSLLDSLYAALDSERDQRGQTS